MNPRLEAINPANFIKMAHGDIASLRLLAMDYFCDTRRQMVGWESLVHSKDFSRLRDDLHRCKGGASLFGLERLVELIGSYESPNSLETGALDLAQFAEELAAAELAVQQMTD